MQRPIFDPASRAEALPLFERKYGKANGRRCIHCGAALYGHQRLFCPKIKEAYNCAVEFDPRARVAPWWKKKTAA